MPDQYEKAVANCGNISELRTCSEKLPDLRQEVKDSLSPCTSLLCDLFRRTEWKDSKVDIFFAACDSEVETFWSVLLDIDNTLQTWSLNRKTVKSKE